MNWTNFLTTENTKITEKDRSNYKIGHLNHFTVRQLKIGWIHK